MGATKSPFYRVVVKEKRSKRDGAYLENLGTYDPKQDPAEVNLKHERIQYWISVGAQPTETVQSLIKNNPAMSEEERATMLQARADKKAAAEAERMAAKKAESERIAAEVAEKTAAAKAEADAAAAVEAEAAAAEAEATAAAEAPAEEAPAADADAAPAEAAPAAEAPAGDATDEAAA